jgi:predicted acylesterase/phospholipase RssA
VKKRHVLFLAAAFLLAIFLIFAGRESYPENPPLERVDPAKGYYFSNLALGEGNTDENIIILSLSGGGMRAAALDYGILEYLESLRLPSGGSLLDEIDIITTSSTSSAVAAYYGLYGKKRFLQDFRNEFLYHELESSLIREVLRPRNWPRLMSPAFARSDIAAEYLGRSFYGNLTYASIPRRRPFIILNATDMSLGAQFSFVQPHFDRLCSDLSGVPIGRAVTASMAFSVAFSPVTMLNYPKEECRYRRPQWVKETLDQTLEEAGSYYDRAMNWIAYEDAAARPYVHLLDGGISDNIGMRAVTTAVTEEGSDLGLQERLLRGEIRRAAVIIVDARTAPNLEKDAKPRPPGIVSVLLASASNPMANYSSETVERLRDFFTILTIQKERILRGQAACEEMARERCAAAQAPEECRASSLRTCREEFRIPGAPLETDLYLAHVRFEAARDETIWQVLNTLPTRLQLPREDIDFLIDEAPKLLEKSEDFQKLLDDLGVMEVD